uniref:sugar ABC transporter permease n=1 Tax=Hydrogenophaga sp. TaxID=1904254 RepID=UPI0035669FA2
AVVGIVATVVVLIIVARHIDLSVGSVMGFVGVLIATLMYTAGWHWIEASLAGLVVAIAVSTYQGALTSMLGVPSFVVTLGGLMSFRGAAFLVADGKTQPVNDAFFQRLGGGFDGSIGTSASWALAGLIVLILGLQTWLRRKARAAYEVPNNPLWLDALILLVPVAIVLAFVAAMNAYQIPNKDAPQGVPIPVLIWGAVAISLSFLVHRTRFGRYVFAMGGNPEAAALVGIPVRKVTLMLFALMGVLITVAAMVSIARLNAGTNSLGTSMELYVIAAAVIGGTALAGGSGSILGSVLGALIMQSIDSGMLLLDVSIGVRYVIIGQVLIVAVVFDVLYRRLTGDTV